MQYHHISVKFQEGIGIVRVVDQLLNDPITAQAMREELLSLPVEHPDTAFIIDMSDVEKIAFGACYALVELQRDHAKVPGGMPLVGLLLTVEKEMRKHGFLLDDARTMFRTFWTIELALAAFAPVREEILEAVA